MFIVGLQTQIRHIAKIALTLKSGWVIVRDDLRRCHPDFFETGVQGARSCSPRKRREIGVPVSKLGSFGIRSKEEVEGSSRVNSDAVLP